MNQILNVSSSVDQQTLASLQVKLLRDSPPDNGQVKQVSADYVELQAALRSGNASEAQTDFVRLQHDTDSANPGAPASGSNAAPSAQAVGGRSAGGQQMPLLNVLA